MSIPLWYFILDTHTNNEEGILKFEFITEEGYTSISKNVARKR